MHLRHAPGPREHSAKRRLVGGGHRRCGLLGKGSLEEGDAEGQGVGWHCCKEGMSES
jgi:hypothetical protein